MPLAVACIDCGQPTLRSPCPTCTSSRNRASPYQRPEWRRLARNATRGRTCDVCGSGDRVTAHHMNPRTDGGPDALENLLPLCGSCHSQYEADVRHDRDTPHRRLIDQIASALT